MRGSKRKKGEPEGRKNPAGGSPPGFLEGPGQVQHSPRKMFFLHGLLLSLGASAELHLRQLDIPNHIGVCEERNTP